MSFAWHYDPSSWWSCLCWYFLEDRMEETETPLSVRESSNQFLRVEGKLGSVVHCKAHTQTLVIRFYTVPLSLCESKDNSHNCGSQRNLLLSQWANPNMHMHKITANTHKASPHFENLSGHLIQKCTMPVLAHTTPSSKCADKGGHRRNNRTVVLST